MTYTIAQIYVSLLDIQSSGKISIIRGLQVKVSDSRGPLVQKGELPENTCYTKRVCNGIRGGTFLKYNN